ncbi:MAG: hypothetical protein AB8D78_13715 [Akkermansiaceae bacterium]
MKNLLATFAGIVGASILFTSCGGSGSSSNDAGDLGPTSARSFVGTTMSFNPTVTFLSGDRVEWVNEETDTDFIEAPASAPLTGTYTYAPAGNFRSGLLTITLDGEDPIFFELEKFVTEDRLVQSFSLEAFGVFYEADVIAGSLFAAEQEGSGGDGGDTGGGSDFTFRDDGNLTTDTTFSKAFILSTEQGDIANSPFIKYTVGQIAEFTVIADGSIVFEGVDGGNITLGFSSASNGLLTYTGFVNGGTTTVTFDTAAVDAQSDLTMLWSFQDFFTPDALDSKSFGG